MSIIVKNSKYSLTKINTSLPYDDEGEISPKTTIPSGVDLVADVSHLGDGLGNRGLSNRPIPHKAIVFSATRKAELKSRVMADTRKVEEAEGGSKNDEKDRNESSNSAFAQESGSSVQDHSSSTARTKLLMVPSSDSIPSMNIYKGSYIKSSTSLRGKSVERGVERSSSQGLFRNVFAGGNGISAFSPSHSVRTSLSHNQLSENIGDSEERETFGLEELRDGFFDASFNPPSALEVDSKELFQGKAHSSSAVRGSSAPSDIWQNVVNFIHRIISNNNAIDLSKAFLGYFICYIFCLITPIREWLGPYSYIAPFTALLHHSGRTSGSQLEISILSIVGLALGLSYGALCIYASTSTAPARHGYGGVDAAMMFPAITIAAWLRANFIRIQHCNLSFSMSVIFATSVGASAIPHYHRLWDLGIPYLTGIVICLVVNLVVFPGFGHETIYQSIQDTLHDSITAANSCLRIDPDSKTGRFVMLNKRSVELSGMFRERTNEISISTLSIKDYKTLRNLSQIFMGRLRAIPSAEPLLGKFRDHKSSELPAIEQLISVSKNIVGEMISNLNLCSEFMIYLKTGHPVENSRSFSSELHEALASHKSLLEGIASLVDEICTPKYLNQERIWPNGNIIEALEYVHFLRESSASHLELIAFYHELSLKKRAWKISPPSYIFKRALKRTTYRIAHDNGGQSAYYYYQSKRDVDDIFEQAFELKPEKLKNNPRKGGLLRRWEFETPKGIDKIAYNTWRVLHRLQAFESKFTTKAVLAVMLTSIPGWVQESQYWYNRYDLWMCAATAYVTLHPRVGGNAHDLIVRSTVCILGIVWAGIGYRAGYGNPYVLAVFCAIFMIPCLYRFIISGHPRSGIIGCISFTFVSLGTLTSQKNDPGNMIKDIWTRGLAILIGMTTSLVLSWILWPFVARHEVRKSMSVLLQHLNQCYQIVYDR